MRRASCPYVVGHASGHCGSDPKRFVDATKVVVHIMQRDSEASGLHPQGKVLPLREASRNVFGIGIAFDPMFDRADALCRAVPLLASRIGTIDFDQHRVIDIRTERSFDCFDEALPQYQTSGGPPRIKSY
jgi:hypothetical protein